jgi:predicted DCC family thiol-disulfide oxidoreductase YuxK
MEKALVLYDGDCGFCRASVDRLRALDWRRRLCYADARDPAVLAEHPRVDPVRALERLQLVRPGEATVLDGFFAFRWIAGRLPLLWPIWPFLWLPGASAVGVRAYDSVARNRFVFGRCEDGACAVPARRAESGETGGPAEAGPPKSAGGS